MACDTHDSPAPGSRASSTLICRSLDDEEMRQLDRLATTVSLPPGRYVFHEGDRNDSLYDVAAGALSLSKLLPDGRRQVVGFRFAGDLLGLSAGREHAFSAEALAPVSLYRFDRRGFAQLSIAHPEVERRLLSLASDELLRAQEHLLILGRKTATERLASVLIWLVRRIGRQDRDGWRVDLPMTRTDLADYIGLTTETVSRTFAHLRGEGVIYTYGVRSLRVPRVEDLDSYSGDA
ncbi:MAG: helix-turn-helix domain-containing protein [Kiloniellaceae bacterium]